MAAGGMRYAKAGDVHIAYSVLSDGPLDLLVVPAAFASIEGGGRLFAPFYGRLGSFSRLIVLDKRGTGRSDPIAGFPTMEERLDDIRAVLDAVGSERTVLYGGSEGGPIAAAFAATYPERVTALVLVGALAKFAKGDGFPWGKVDDDLTFQRDYADRLWGSGLSISYFAPSFADQEWMREQWGRAELAGGSPGSVTRMLDTMAEFDARAVYPTIRVPTLVLHRVDDQVVDVNQGRYLAGQIPGAKYVELPGADHVPMGNSAEDVADEVEEFVTGVRRGPDPDRVLATVLFTDIVGSTQRAEALGDRAWRDLLGRHDAVVREKLDRYRGREVKTTGDGFLATFDGPARAIRCASEISVAAAGLGLDVRAGIHTGECEVVNGDVRGIAVHTGARVAAAAGGREILVSGTVKDLVAGSGIAFEDRGVHELKGLAGEWRLYAVVS